MSKGLIESKAASVANPEEMTALLKTMTADDYRKAYLDYANEFLTYEGFASFYGLESAQAAVIIDTGRAIQDLFANALKRI